MRSRGWLPVAALLAGYALLQIFVLPPLGFFTGDQGPKYLQTWTFATQGIAAPDIAVRSRDIDPALEFQDPILHSRGGRLVSAFSWLLPLLTVPFVWAFGDRGLYVVPALATASMLLSGRALGRGMGLGSGWWSGAAAALATPMLFFGAELWEHAPAGACVLAAAVLLMPARASRADTGAWRRWAAAGAACAAGALFREEAAFALPALLAARALAHRGDAIRAACWSIAGAAAIAAVTVPINLAVYGSALPLHLTSEIAKAASWWSTRVEAFAEMVLPSPGGVLFAIAVLGAAAALFAVRRRPAATRVAVAHVSAAAVLVSLVAVPVWRLATGVPHPLDGFTMGSVAHTWVFAIALLYVAASPRAETPELVRVSYPIFAALFLCAATLAIVPSGGGAQWSPRYFAPAAPLLATVAPAPFWTARGMGSALSRQVTAVVGLILIASIVVQLEGLTALRRTKEMTRAVAVTLAEQTSEDEVVISTVPWLPEICAPLLASRRIVFAAAQETVDRVVTRARGRGLTRIALASVDETGGVTLACRPAGAPISIGLRLTLRRYRCEP